MNIERVMVALLVLFIDQYQPAGIGEGQRAKKRRVNLDIFLALYSS